MQKHIYLLLFTFFLGGCASKNELVLFHSLDANRTDTRNHLVSRVSVSSRYTAYRIKRYDRLMVNLYGDFDLALPPKGLLVDDTGRITLPLIGRVRVTGLTQPQAAGRIQTSLRRFYPDAIAAVEVLDKEVYVVGDVTKPGAIPLLHEKTTLLKAISHAGGFKDSANKEFIYLVRKRGSKARLTRLSLSGSASLKNAFLTLLPDDIIYVAPNTAKLINLGPVETLKIIGAAMSPFSAVKTLVN